MRRQVAGSRKQGTGKNAIVLDPAQKFLIFGILERAMNRAGITRREMANLMRQRKAASVLTQQEIDEIELIAVGTEIFLGDRTKDAN